MWREGRRLTRASRLNAAALAVSIWASGCETGEIRDGSNPPDSVLRAELGLPETAHVHRIVLTGRGADERVTPRQVDIAEGDYVEFYVADGRVHTVSFPLDSLSEAARAFLTGSDQGASPPLLERGARFVLTFRDAPEARYPFMSAAHGDTAYGVVVVGDGGAGDGSGDP